MLSRHCAALVHVLCLLSPLYVQTSHAAVAISSPSSPPPADANVVYSNFLGISIELSFINYYFGNSTDQIPQPLVKYLSALQARASGKPVRLRLGGNSMDSSTYVPDQQQIIQFTDPNANFNDQPVNYGPQLFDVMKGVSNAVGGAQYLVGLSLRTPNSSNIPLLAGDAANALGDDLDALLLGNEPDLYTAHGNRPGLKNYTTDDYIGDYNTVFNSLEHTPKGDVLSLDKIAGPTICCFWDLAPVLQSGWLNKFANRLKYITLQHYPQNNCQGKPQYGLDYYTAHANAVSLAQWQEGGIQLVASSGENRKPVLMDEFNTASCGGVPGISDTFAASLWTADYSLQMAAVGYAGAYLHTRERGITYNLFDPPDAVAGGAGPWTTNPSFYGMLPVAEALQSANGSRVVDLNVQNSKTDKKATVAGYAIYDGTASDIHSLVVFNFANASGATTDYSIDSSLPSSSGNILIRYLTAPSINEKTNIAWGGKTYAGVGDANPVDATFSSSIPDKNMSCAGGCTIQIPGPGLAVVFLGEVPDFSKTGGSSSANATNNSSPSSTSPAAHSSSGASRSGVASIGVVSVLVLAFVAMI
ncbi:glycoside hydrolase family 79 protein [Pilatotrama ljubarskyi]|nr:glycoside hydrolase family 79 protein [Pilatotrama ljubarskyi]